MTLDTENGVMKGRVGFLTSKTCFDMTASKTCRKLVFDGLNRQKLS